MKTVSPTDCLVLPAPEVAEYFDAHSAALQRYLLSIGIPRHDSEEAVQETFLALFEHLEAGKPRDNLRGWLFRVAHNHGLKLRLRQSRFVEAVPDTHPDPEPDPEQRAVYNQRQLRLLAVVKALPELDRSCLSLRAEGFRYREIAEILGISLGSVANALARALDKLSRVDQRA